MPHMLPGFAINPVDRPGRAQVEKKVIIDFTARLVQPLNPKLLPNTNATGVWG